MMTTIALVAGVIVIEAVPVYGYMNAIFLGQEAQVTTPMILAFVGVIVLCVGATVVPLKIGLQRMESFEF